MRPIFAGRRIVPLKELAVWLLEVSRECGIPERELEELIKPHIYVLKVGEKLYAVWKG